MKTITEYFKQNIKKLNAYNAKGKIRIFFSPAPTNSEINEIVKSVNIDCSKYFNNLYRWLYLS
ncbi:hypothetical protein FACS1894145_7580 [Bacteroidia bacterium]|nr:hypothetical protein FACS1894145_7580 [Bacteroidia bacterium]